MAFVPPIRDPCLGNFIDRSVSVGQMSITHFRQKLMIYGAIIRVGTLAQQRGQTLPAPVIKYLSKLHLLLSETLPHVKAKISRTRHRREKSKMRATLNQRGEMRASDKWKAVQEKISKMTLIADKRLRNSVVARAAKRKLTQLNSILAEISELRRLCQCLIEFRQSQMLESSYDHNIQTISDQCAAKKNEILVQIRALKQAYQWCISDPEHRVDHLQAVDVSANAGQETLLRTNSIDWKLFKSPIGRAFEPEAYKPVPPSNPTWSKYFREN